MGKNERKKVALLAAVLAYIKNKEEESIILTRNETVSKNCIKHNLWGISGRQNVMQMRNLIQLKVF